MIFSKISLFKRFAIFSFIPFIITGIVLGILITNHVTNDKIQNIEDLASLTIDTLVKPELSQSDLSKPISDLKNKFLKQKFETILKANNFININIWSAEGNLMFSTDYTFENYHEINKALLLQAINSGKSNYSIINLSDHDKSISNNKEVIKIFTPILQNKIILGVFEVYVPYDEVKQHVAMLNQLIFIVMLSGLLILYVLLLKIIYNASNTLISQNRSLKEQKDSLERSLIALNSTYKSTVVTLSKAVDARDPYTAGHSDRVAAISLEIGNALDLSSDVLEKLEMSALFHDIGKLGVPDNILLKPGKLNELEFQKIKEHPTIGVSILRNIDFLEDSLPIILHHHERYSGGGYPDGISKSDIPLESRIIAVADSYDAMTSDRPYRKGLSHEDAILEIIKFKGIQFDPAIVDSFLNIEVKKLIKSEISEA